MGDWEKWKIVPCGKPLVPLEVNPINLVAWKFKGKLTSCHHKKTLGVKKKSSLTWHTQDQDFIFSPEVSNSGYYICSATVPDMHWSVKKANVDLKKTTEPSFDELFIVEPVNCPVIMSFLYFLKSQ
jgi:hypothetical protein